ncbi:MAG: hypothetical protein IPL52_04015 [Flavobacteriales bacterium]|nr:hypothetical protein [Flavobacteriales bacterium]
MRLLTICSFTLLSLAISAQTVLFNEDFESAPAFTLNTTDAASTISAWNTWVINSSYTGGDGDVVCLGFPFGYTIVNTPAQPGGISTPNGNYLHTASVEGIADGITCCSFGAADGFCITADNTFSRMSTDVSTLGSADVQLKFWWLCQGGSSFYGQVYYSTDGGGTWTNVGAQYNLQGSWTEQTVTLPAFGNQATLRFGFRFVNSVGLGALDPGFGIDDVRIIASAAVPNSIATNALSGTAFCQGAQISVPYTAVGTYIAGNIFSAQLSDAAGSFASPTIIGSLSSTVSGSITCTIPVLTPVGAGYRIRVVSDQPVTVGSDNGLDISITSAPYAGADDAVVICKNTGLYALADFIPGASACGTWTAPGGGAFSGTFNSSTDNAGAYTYTTNCPGGCPQDNSTITITLQDPANAGNDANAALCSTNPPASLIPYVDGGDLTGIFWYNGATNPPPFGTAGSYAMQYVVYGTAPCVNDTADFVFTVNAAADAGANNSISVCADAPPVALITYLGGNAQAGGVWTGPSGGAVSGVLNPATDASGLYTYTVNGTAPCADDQAFVAVVIDPCSGVEERASGGGARWLGERMGMHQFELAQSAISMDVVDATGRVAFSVPGPFAPGLNSIDLQTLAAGAHIVRFIGDAPVSVRIVNGAR